MTRRRAVRNTPSTQETHHIKDTVLPCAHRPEAHRRKVHHDAIYAKSEKSFENGIMTLPEYCGKPSMPARKGTEPGTDDAERSPIRPTIAARPLRISDLSPRAFFSAELFWTRLKGSLHGGDGVMSRRIPARRVDGVLVG